jgi:adenosine deaminase
MDRLPKILLHDHLDGGLRASTVLELAREVGYVGLPHADVDRLAAWFDQAESGSLERYLASFAHTVAVMQTPSALERVAYECVEDWAACGVVYGEVRFAPSLHRAGGMTREQIIEAVLDGLAAGTADTGVLATVIVDAMRQYDDAAEVAEVAVRYADRGVVGFDLAGPEAGFPASRHREAIEVARAGGLHITIHAGEAAGPDSIADALDCGAERLGHGVRVIDDITAGPGGNVEMGSVASRVHDERIALEVCPTSNIGTRAFPSPAEHPLGALYRGGFEVTLNTDNRLMSATNMELEFDFAVEHHGFTGDDLRTVTLSAAEAAFCDDATRAELRAKIEAGYAER